MEASKWKPLENSEDVQDALIEDYFRYDDLLRMEVDYNISMINVYSGERKSTINISQ